MSDSCYNSSPTRSSGLGLTRANILGPGPDSNKPGSRKGIQGISLTPARSITTAGISLSSGQPPREQYQSVYSSRLGRPLTNSAPNISNLSVPNDRQSGDSLSGNIKPGRASISSLRLSPRRVSADPRLTRLGPVDDENSGDRQCETPRRGSEQATSSLQRKLNVGEAGYKRFPVNLSRTNSDIEYSQRIRYKASKTSETFSPRSPDGNGDSVKPDSGYNSPRHSEFTYNATSITDSVTTGSPLPRNSASYPSNLTETVSDDFIEKVSGINVKNFDTVDSGYEKEQNSEKLRYDSGYYSPRYERNVENQNQQNKSSDNSGQFQSPSGNDERENSSRSNVNRYYSGKTGNAILETASENFSSGSIVKGNDNNRIVVGDKKESKQRPVGRGSNLESTPEHSILTTNLDNSGLVKHTVSPSVMSASKQPQERQGSLNDPAEETPTPQPRTRRRLTKRISFKRVEDDEYIGFATLPEQVHRKAVRRGFEFTLMVVGETGLGKSTLINSLFLTDLYKDRKLTNIEERIQKTVELEKKELEIEERGVKLKLTIVDTPGFNDAVNAEESWKPIVDYVDSQFEAYFKAESGLNRKNIKDTRVHCCLYFISPYGHGLRPVDVMVMRKLHNKVNIVPLIAKSDMLTKQECKRLKDRITEEIERHRIRIYQFPDCDSDEDEDFKQQDKELKASIPFAVVGSNTVVEAPGGKKIRGRMYPWGIVEVENPQHCDFIRLRQMLISTHMQDLKDVTCDIHYENYRAEHISEQMGTQRRDRNKLKRDSTPNMEAVLETDLLLQQKEAEIERMREMMRQMEAKIRSQNSPQMNGRVGNV